MMEFLQSIVYWHWLVFGLVLILIEIFAPSAIFLWPGIASILTGILAFTMPHLNVQILLLIWAGLSLAFAFGFQLYRKKNPAAASDPSLNRRGEQYVGRHYTLGQDILNGTGELRVDDTRWKVVSYKDLPAGTKVKVLRVEGTSLRVEEYIS